MAEDKSTMREKMARALSDWHERHADFDGHGPYPSTFLDGADAVLEAMRAPTPEMIDKGITAAENVEDWTRDSFESYRVDDASDMPLPVWKAMIDAAKAGK